MKFTMILVLCWAVIVAADLALDEQWKKTIVTDLSKVDHKGNFLNWKKAFNKKYPVGHKSEIDAFKNFMFNWKKINDHNTEGKHTYVMGVNQFSDMTVKEFRKYIHGGAKSCFNDRSKMRKVSEQRETPKKGAPSAIDWTNHNGKSYVTAVKNQGQCGSCWSFSATGAIESQTAIATDTTGSNIVTLSEQELVDCSGAYGNQGCNGGLMDAAFLYVTENKGLCSESEYPYQARNGKCRKSECKTIYDPISRYKTVTRDSESSLVDAVSLGPVSIGIEADQSAFMHYKSGIIDGSCGTTIDHGVLAVGYGSDSGQDFWKVKNSWGPTWGENGYVRICRNCHKNNGKGECGILTGPSYPIVHSNDKSPSRKSIRQKLINVFYDVVRRFGW